MIKYLVYPGKVRSKTDGQIHYVGFLQLCDLYRVNPKECADMSQEKNQKLNFSSLKKLMPDYSGDYIL